MSQETTYTFADGLISQQDLQSLGLNNIGYIRAARIRGEQAYELHAADGTAIAVRDNDGELIAIAAEQSIGLAPLH